MEKPKKSTEVKLKSLTLEEKLKLIEIVESGKAVKEVADEFSLNRNTLHYILKHREKIKQSVSANPGIGHFKRIKQTKSPELEERVLLFMNECRARGEKITGTNLKTMALTLANELNVDNFSASNGWLFSFLKRNKIVISEFNKYSDQAPSSSFILEALGEHVKDEQEQHQLVVEHEYNIIHDEGVVDEIELEQEELVMKDFEDEQFAEVEVTPPWYSWCRLCGNRDAMGIDEKFGEIVQELFAISIEDQNLSICESCTLFLEDITNMKNKVAAVGSLVEVLESAAEISEEEIDEIRLEHGFDVESTADLEPETEIGHVSTQVREASENFEEVMFEDIEELMDDLDQDETEQDENIEFETTELSNISKADIENSYEYKCHICEEIFEKMCFLSNHTRSAHQCLPKVACTCGRMLSTWDSLMIHRAKHSPPDKMFFCDICDNNFRTKTGLSIHIKFKHEKPQRTYHCDSCGRRFKDATLLKTHLRTHLPDEEKFTFECPICHKRLVNKWSLKYHISTIHEKLIKFHCNICDRGFGNKSNLRSHLISHTTENVECDLCGGRFKNRISLQSHKKIHKPEDTKRFSCPICDKSFRNHHHVQRHLMTHSDDRPFKCEYMNCRSEYKWKKDLVIHISSVHTGDKIYKCFFCEQSFSDSVSARRHKLREHPDEVAAFEAEHGKGRKIEQYLIGTN